MENNDMIFASTARTATKMQLDTFNKKAKEFAKSELHFLNEATKKAIKEGKFKAVYWWNGAIFEEEQIKPSDFADAIKSYLQDYGYDVVDVVTFKDSGRSVKDNVRIEWSWRGNE